MPYLDHVILPVAIMYLLFQIPPTLFEVYAYYMRGGLVEFDISMDGTFHQDYSAWLDWHIYIKRFLDRPNSDAAKAFYAFLDWSACAWDRSVFINRRFLAKRDREVSKLKPYLYEPFIFNWKGAHNKQWLRGDDAAGFLMPAWGPGGEARAKAELPDHEEDQPRAGNQGEAGGGGAAPHPPTEHHGLASRRLIRTKRIFTEEEFGKEM